MQTLGYQENSVPGTNLVISIKETRSVTMNIFRKKKKKSFLNHL